MSRKQITITYCFIAILALLSALTIYRAVSYGFLLSINTYLGIATIIIIIFVAALRYKLTMPFMLVLLSLYLFNIINFTVENIHFGISGQTQSAFESITINPFAFFLLIIYWLVNKDYIKSLYTENDEERTLKFNKMVEFYYEKFSNVPKDELKSIIINYSKYPDEAKAALDRLK